MLRNTVFMATYLSIS
uniref:Uncharacterized protein n=1 Tax=Rhizophora mucronata TaxID=61149 RepID=A0A2P2N5W9_RHIMU